MGRIHETRAPTIKKKGAFLILVCHMELCARLAQSNAGGKI